MNTKKTKDLVKEVGNIYTKTNYGYRRIAKYIFERYNIKVSHQTVKRWVLEAQIKPKEGKEVKEGSRAFYKREYEKLLKKIKDVERENMELKEALELYKECNSQIEELKKARDKDRKVINMLFKEVIKNCDRNTRIKISKTYTEIYNLNK